MSRAAAIPVKLAVVAPVANPTPLPAGSPSRSRSQAAASSSAAATPGVTWRSTAFWSHAPTSQSAASAAGCEPPITNPKNRPDGIATSPGSTAPTSRSTTSSASDGRSGSSRPSASATVSASAAAGMSRSARLSSQVVACRWARSSAAFVGSVMGPVFDRRGPHAMTRSSLLGVGKVYDAIDGRLREFVEAQQVFFVATAPLAGGHVNVSPKGIDGTFTVVDEHTVAYLDITASGAETIAHLREPGNGRITVMFCSFGRSPDVVRLHGTGRVVGVHDEEYAAWVGRFARDPGCPGRDRRRRRAGAPTRAATACR